MPLANGASVTPPPGGDSRSRCKVPACWKALPPSLFGPGVTLSCSRGYVSPGERRRQAQTCLVTSFRSTGFGLPKEGTCRPASGECFIPGRTVTINGPLGNS